MKSAFECFQQAAKCERMAMASHEKVDRIMLLETAQYWRTLGEQAKADEATLSRKESLAGR
jgi:hypothetical protein